MREGVGKALRRAFGQEDLIRKLEPREGGVSHLMNAKRRAVFAWLLRAPCSHLRELSRELEIPTQTMKWHLEDLEKAGILASVAVGNRKCFYVPARIERDDVPPLSHLSDGMNRGILAMLGSRGPLSQRDIFKSLGTYYQAVQPRLKALERDGLVRSDRRQRNRTYEISEWLSDLRDGYLERKSDTTKRVKMVLQEDGLAPKVAKTLARSTIFSVDAGTGREEIELFHDPLAIIER